eukprot:6836191-Prymnesium_polylepis.1
MIYSYPSLPLIYVYIPPLKSSDEAYGEWKPFILTPAPPHALLSGNLDAWALRYTNQTVLYGWQLGTEVAPYPEDESSLIAQVRGVDGETEFNKRMEPAGITFRSIASAQERSSADAARAGVLPRAARP